MLIIHHLHQSRSERTVWLAEELALDYELVKHQRDPQTLRAPASLWAVSPLGKAPVIEDQGLVIFESGAVAQYLVERHGHGRLQPAPDSRDWIRYQQWMHSAESTLALPAMIQLMTGMMQLQSPLLEDYVEQEYRTQFRFLEQSLEQHEYVAGAEFSAADTMVAYLLWILDGSALKKIGIAPRSPLRDYPQILNYMERMRQRPAHLRAREKMAD
jgi:glutathione S-transferase